jgi:hypothetical protein
MARGSRKTRINLSVDPQIHKAAMQRFAALGMSASGFVESQLAFFLQVTEPIVPLLEAENSELTPEIRAAARSFFTRSAALAAQGTSTITDLHAKFQESDTDK